jgi:1-phosphofructokinase family hexose kinase
MVRGAQPLRINVYSPRSFTSLFESRAMLLIVTPNPSLDRTMLFRGLRLGAVQRTSEVLLAAGGKGLNVARAAGTLGQPALVCAPVGGHAGAHFVALAAAEGIAGRWSRHSCGETRTCVLLIDPEAEDATALNEAGPTLDADAWNAFAADVQAAASRAALCLVTGSLPPGVAAADLAALVEQLMQAGRRVIVDTSGAALNACLAVRPWGLKVNGAELGAAVGRSIEDVASALAALRELVNEGSVMAAVSLGAQGCVAATAFGGWWARPPQLRVTSSVGSGDSLLAGLATGLVRALPLAEALRLGVACGTADALTVGGGLIDAQTVAELQQQVEVVGVR